MNKLFKRHSFKLFLRERMFKKIETDTNDNSANHIIPVINVSSGYL